MRLYELIYGAEHPHKRKQEDTVPDSEQNRQLLSLALNSRRSSQAGKIKS